MCAREAREATEEVEGVGEVEGRHTEEVDKHKEKVKELARRLALEPVQTVMASDRVSVLVWATR